MEIVDITSVNHVARVDEELCTPHGLEEITWSLHLRHELDEQLSTGVCVHTLHESVDAPDDTARVGKSIVVDYRWVISVRIRRDGGRVNSRSGRPENRNGIVGGAVRHHAHADEHN